VTDSSYSGLGLGTEKSITRWISSSERKLHWPADGLGLAGFHKKHIPRPIRSSAPFSSRNGAGIDLGIGHEMRIRAGKFALITPVMTLDRRTLGGKESDGFPRQRASCARRMTAPSTILPEVCIRSANSSTTTTIKKASQKPLA